MTGETRCEPIFGAGGKVLGWRCFGDIEARWFAHLAEESERDWEGHEDEMSHEANATLYDREPELWSARADTDPYWPPPEVDPFLLQAPELIAAQQSGLEK